MTLPQITLYHKAWQVKQRRETADSLLLSALAAGGDEKAINRKLEELRG
jgi:hypothetical protein